MTDLATRVLEGAAFAAHLAAWLIGAVASLLLATILIFALSAPIAAVTRRINHRTRIARTSRRLHREG